MYTFHVTKNPQINEKKKTQPIGEWREIVIYRNKMTLHSAEQKLEQNVHGIFNSHEKVLKMLTKTPHFWFEIDHS